MENVEASSHKFSVLISVYKDDHADFLSEALESISFVQTLKPDEIIIVADGPLPQDTISVIQSFIEKFDRTTTFIELKENVGLAKALNIGLENCSYDLVARMDADDLSLPDRFKQQISFFNNNASVSVCGGYINEVDARSLDVVACRKVPIEHDDICYFARSRSPMSHPSVMFRKKAVIDNGGYPLFRKSQDYALWSLLITKNIKFANIPVVLVNMRAGDDLQKRRGFRHLKYELSVLNFQRKIKFISWNQYIYNFAGRVVLRLMPVFIRKILYKLAR
ncbi:glycosyltransferase involved in cell wall biosynthesis [Erwinia toletana]|uniref:Glycosyltransferase involved in cell wall biosynthesis n=1 Tax=Winslowiella toletana TaxID=92490 RepID=A0ABS4P4A0_9GAMM|nr:glycosyltransferase [Winslowiella toletana]MBP2167466.1 glycosyltransferase involved in cell wall biosynthesis [Winslowiella toletana]